MKKIVSFFGLGLLLGLILLLGIVRLAWHSKFYPGITVAGVSLTGLTRDQAKSKLTERTQNYQAQFIFNGSGWEAPKEAVNFNIEMTLNEAYRYGRRLKIEDYLLLLINKKTSYPLKMAEGKTEKLEGLINEIATSVEIPPIEPIIEVVGKGVKVSNGSDGVMLDSEKLERKIGKVYSMLNDEAVEIPTKIVKQAMTTEELLELTTKAEKLAQASLTLTLDDEKIILGGKELVTLLSEPAVQEYVAGISTSLNREPQDARFEFSEGKVKEFAPGKDGVEIKIQDLVFKIQEEIEKLLNENEKTTTIEVPVMRTPPKVTTGKVNELGIRERIGRGESYYQHSIPNRIYNVGLASSRINSVLIPPGEEVSFNKIVGEVSGATGYLPAYIISGGRTVLGDGGGLCQVSTTMFRAVMAAGLPILERWAHAYRVSYYELNSKPGVDATVIAPSKDFRFKNDTPGHILIQTINDPKKLFLVIEIYGTSDGRVATISEPKVWGISPPPPNIYQDDPSLPTGTTRQVDWSAWGAKASFEYKVVRGEEILQEKTYTSAYRPWANVYLRGTGSL